MKTYWFRSVAVLFIIVVLSLETHAADTSNVPFSARVKISVSSKSDNIKNTVSSYLNREIRSLNDVELVDNNPECEIRVMAMEIETTSGYKKGVVLSTLIIGFYNNQQLSSLFQPNYKDDGLKMTSGLKRYISQGVSLGSIGELQELCKDVVTNFDTNHLEEGRKVLRQLKEWLKK